MRDPLTWTDSLGLTPLNDPGWMVYGLYDEGPEPYCVGITKRDQDLREAEHVKGGRLGPETGRMRPIEADLEYQDARGTEQALIEKHRTRTGTRGEPTSSKNRGNKVNSFDKSRTDTRGKAFNRSYAKAKKKHCGAR